MTNTIESIAPVVLPGPPDYRASGAAYREYARICASLILWARPLTPITGDGLVPLIVAVRSWPKGADDSAAARAALAAGDVDAFVAAMGAPLSVSLSEDGRAFATSRYCYCKHVLFDDRVYVERWTAEGRDFHGWVHRDCRYLTQVG